jgi:hypothetical protein
VTVTSRPHHWTARPDTRRDVDLTSSRARLLRRVLTVGDLYLQRLSATDDRWRAMVVPGPRAGLQPLRPIESARALLALWRGAYVYGVQRPELYGMTVRLHVSRGAELALLDWEGGGR